MSNSLARWTPYREMEQLQNHINSLFDWSFGRRGESESLDATWYPRVDVVEKENEYLINAEIPGVKKNDVKVAFENGVLTISGERKDEREEKNARYHVVERSWGSFRRSFTLPGNTDADKINADFKDGILTVKVAKSESAKPKQIEVK